MNRVPETPLSLPARILIVDDDAVFRREFKEYLDDYGVMEAANGEAALHILKKPNEIDLVVLDVRMSGMDGIEVLARIKQTAPQIKVIILTGMGSKDVAVDALRGRADDYIEKTFSNAAVRETIAKHLDVKERQDFGEGIEGKIARVKFFIEKNCHKKITLLDAAAIVSLSPKYLSRAFREHLDRGFNEYALSLKIKLSKKLLKTTQNTVENISYQLGYQNSESFIRQFKKIVHCTPTEFRAKTVNAK
ncbi:MAG: response regulator [Candidatus Omnitrophica bacterium]|nr:response regulator [Candidatus Omnitrophota bacterium]